MGVYLAKDKYNQLISVFKDVKLAGLDVKTEDGLLYFIKSYPFEFIESNSDRLDEDRFSELKSLIKQSPWLDNKEELIDILISTKNLQALELLKVLGDKYFDKHEFDLSIDYYSKIIDLNKDLNLEYQRFLDHAYCRIGIILLTIGEVNEGIDLIEYAYTLKNSPEIQLQLVKYQVEFNLLKEFSIVENLVAEILNHPSQDEKLSFLVWYYNYIGDYESSVTSYMQIKDLELRFKLVDYYMVYMLESKQSIAMESYLKPLREFNEYRYLVELIGVYIQLENYEEALNIIKNINQDLNKNNSIIISKSKCYLGLNRIIESVTAINLIDRNSLDEEDRESYYIQLGKLSKFSKDFSKEHTYNRLLLSFWQEKYRKIYWNILQNTKWKVNK